MSERYTTYAVDDFFGCGLSRCMRPVKNADDLVRWLDELFDALGLGGNIHAAGLSYGGWLISQYALRFPAKLDKLVLLAPAATVLPIRAEMIARAILGALPHRCFARSFLRWVFEDLARQDEDGQLLEDVVEAILMKRECFGFNRMIWPTVLSGGQLRSITNPVLFLVGEREKLYSPARAVARLNRVAPRITARIIPGAGHDLTIVKADEVNAAILEFLEQ